MDQGIGQGQDAPSIVTIDFQTSEELRGTNDLNVEVALYKRQHPTLQYKHRAADELVFAESIKIPTSSYQVLIGSSGNDIIPPTFNRETIQSETTVNLPDPLVINHSLTLIGFKITLLETWTSSSARRVTAVRQVRTASGKTFDRFQLDLDLVAIDLKDIAKGWRIESAQLKVADFVSIALSPPPAMNSYRFSSFLLKEVGVLDIDKRDKDLSRDFEEGFLRPATKRYRRIEDPEALLRLLEKPSGSCDQAFGSGTGSNSPLDPPTH